MNNLTLQSQINDKGEIIRTFSGGVLDNCLGGEIVWDGLDETGKVVPDGRYQIRVLDENGLVVAETYAVVDNNQSSLSDAVGTPHFFDQNITCNIPGIWVDHNTDYYEADWALQWFSDESGMLVSVDTSQDQVSDYPDGLYTLSPDGEQISRLTPWEWQPWLSGTNYRYLYNGYELSKDEESIVFVLDKYTQINWDSLETQIWTVDRYGQNLSHVITFNQSQTPMSVEEISYAPDRSKIAYTNDYDNSIYVINSDGTGNIKLAQHAYVPRNPTWSPDSSHVAYLNFYSCPDREDLYRLWVADVNGNLQEHTEFNNVVEFKWLNQNSLVVVDNVAAAGNRLNYIYNVWLIDVTGNVDPIKIAENIYDQVCWNFPLMAFWLYSYGDEFNNGIQVNPINT